MFGDILKNLRKEYNLTQKELGEKIGISDRVIGYYEAGERFPSDENVLKKIAKVFNVSVDYLLGITDIRNPISTDFTKKDEKEVEKYIEQMRQSLEQNEGLMLSGEPVSPEAIESIIEALEYGYRQAKKINKKYTPKKYRKDE